MSNKNANEFRKMTADALIKLLKNLEENKIRINKIDVIRYDTYIDDRIVKTEHFFTVQVDEAFSKEDE